MSGPARLSALRICSLLSLPGNPGLSLESCAIKNKPEIRKEKPETPNLLFDS